MAILELMSKEGAGWWEAGEWSTAAKRCREGNPGGPRVRDGGKICQ